MRDVKIYLKNLVITFIIIVPSYVILKYIFGVDELQTSDILIPFVCTLMLLNYSVFFENKGKGKKL